MSTTTIDPNIEALLADVAGNAQDAMDSAGSGDWAPPCTGSKTSPAVYDVVGLPITRVNQFTSKKDGKNYPVMNLSFTVLSGEFEGKEGTIPLFFNNQVSCGVARTLAGLLGYTGKDVAGIIRHIVANYPGKAYQMARYLSPAKSGDPFQNTDFLQVLS